MGASICKPCKKKRKIVQGGSILDRVISQSSNQDQCLLYKLANYKKGGELIDAYNLGGQFEVEKLIREQFGQLMYQEGKGQIINRSEYLRWKFRDFEQVVLPIEASLSPHDPLAKWEDHEACWQMQYRGSLGESLIHVLIICDTKIHTRIARTLIKCFPKLAMDVVEGEEYLGAGSLHLAIAYNNNELAQDLVEAGANVNQRAVGSFFLPRDQQRPKPAKHTEYEGLAYLGEYPLAWAACCANESVYNLLLDSGAHPDYQDNFGNMILHMVVVCDKLDMFGYALRHPRLPASNGIVNIAGLTPLTLACKLGRAEVFREMLELSAKEFWRYSNITCSAYPLNALDTLLPDGSTNWNSALFIILNGTKEEHLDMLDGGIIQRLLEEKWKTFARNQFLKRLLILMVHLIFLSLAVYMRPDDPDEPLLGYSDDPVVITRYMCEIGTVLGVLSYLIFQQGDEIKNQGLWTFLKQQYHSPPKAIFLVANVLILICIFCRLQGDRNTEEAILLFAVPGSWFLLMFFAGAVRLTGPFVTMIYSMITGDMLTFGIIYTIVLFGFSQSFYFLYKGFPGVKATLYGSYPTTWMALFQITLGNYDYQELSNTTYPGVSKTVFALFMVFVPILLLNMLIAMMGNTYAHVIEQSEKEWMKQWAKIVITLERAIPQSDAHHYLQEYSISLGPSEDPGTEQRGVMVIKSKSKTRAKQRKGAVTNWKRVGKVTVKALKKKNMTGEQMRCLMWGRESINTPIKTKGPKIDPLLDPKGPSITGAFGGALTAALDVISFTHEVDINAASQGLNLANNPQLTAAQKQLMNVNNSGLIANAMGSINANLGFGTQSNLINTTQAMTNVNIGLHQTNSMLTNLNMNLNNANLGLTNLINPMTINRGLNINKGLTNVNINNQINPANIGFNLPNVNINNQINPANIGFNLPNVNVNNQINPANIGLNLTNLGVNNAQTVQANQSLMSGNQQYTNTGTFGQFSNTQTVTQMIPKTTNLIPTISANVPIMTPAILSEDPLRDLVISAKAEPQYLNQLAVKAANLLEVEEVVASEGTTSTAKSLAGIFAGTENYVKKIEESVKKKYTALDPSDSEGYGDVLLGKVYRTKRAKSATSRKSSAKNHKCSDKRKLLRESESSSTDTVVNAVADKKPDLDFAEERMRQVKESMRQDADGGLLRPINIDVALGNEPQIAKTELIIKGEGNGNDNESGHAKIKRKKRPKTAKTNRVSPIVDQSNRNCQSAVNIKQDSDPESDPDPLDAWSTKGITNMNTILAWDNDPDSM